MTGTTLLLLLLLLFLLPASDLLETGATTLGERRSTVAEVDEDEDEEGTAGTAALAAAPKRVGRSANAMPRAGAPTLPGLTMTLVARDADSEPNGAPGTTGALKS